MQSDNVDKDYNKAVLLELTPKLNDNNEVIDLNQSCDTIITNTTNIIHSEKPEHTLRTKHQVIFKGDKTLISNDIYNTRIICKRAIVENSKLVFNLTVFSTIRIIAKELILNYKNINSNILVGAVTEVMYNQFSEQSRLLLNDIQKRLSLLGLTLDGEKYRKWTELLGKLDHFTYTKLYNTDQTLLIKYKVGSCENDEDIIYENMQSRKNRMMYSMYVYMPMVYARMCANLLLTSKKYRKEYINELTELLDRIEEIRRYAWTSIDYEFTEPIGKKLVCRNGRSDMVYGYVAAIQSYYYIAYALVEDTYINSDSDYTEELHKCRNHLLRKDLVHKDI